MNNSVAWKRAADSWQRAPAKVIKNLIRPVWVFSVWTINYRMYMTVYFLPFVSANGMMKNNETTIPTVFEDVINEFMTDKLKKLLLMFSPHSAVSVIPSQCFFSSFSFTPSAFSLGFRAEQPARFHMRLSTLTLSFFIRIIGGLPRFWRLNSKVSLQRVVIHCYKCTCKSWEGEQLYLIDEIH